MREVMVIGSGFGSSAALRVAQLLAEHQRNDLRVILVDESLGVSVPAEPPAGPDDQVLVVSRTHAEQMLAAQNVELIASLSPRFTMADVCFEPAWTADYSGYQTREDVRRMRQQSRHVENQRQQSLQARARPRR